MAENVTGQKHIGKRIYFNDNLGYITGLLDGVSHIAKELQIPELLKECSYNFQHDSGWGESLSLQTSYEVRFEYSLPEERKPYERVKMMEIESVHIHKVVSSKVHEAPWVYGTLEEVLYQLKSMPQNH